MQETASVCLCLGSGPQQIKKKEKKRKKKNHSSKEDGGSTEYPYRVSDLVRPKTDSSTRTLLPGLPISTTQSRHRFFLACIRMAGYHTRAPGRPRFPPVDL